MSGVRPGQQGALHWPSLEAWVAGRLSPARWAHVCGVVATAEELAQRFGVDVAAARLAALLHDAAREMPGDLLLKKVVEFGIVVDDVEIAVPFLLHGPVAAALAVTEWGITHPGVLAAVRHHTTGRPGMGDLEKVLMVADYCEPGRSFPGVEAVREAAGQDLQRALRLLFRQRLEYLLQRGQRIPPQTVAAYNQLMVGEGP